MENPYHQWGGLLVRSLPFAILLPTSSFIRENQGTSSNSPLNNFKAWSSAKQTPQDYLSHKDLGSIKGVDTRQENTKESF